MPEALNEGGERLQKGGHVGQSVLHVGIFEVVNRGGIVRAECGHKRFALRSDAGGHGDLCGLL